jgi:hypothetical protein
MTIESRLSLDGPQIEKPPTCCFICEQAVSAWEAPYVDLGVDGIGRKAFAHFICWQNARSPIVAGLKESA